MGQPANQSSLGYSKMLAEMPCTILAYGTYASMQPLLHSLVRKQPESSSFSDLYLIAVAGGVDTVCSRAVYTGIEASGRLTYTCIPTQVVSILEAFFLAMAMHPQEQRKAQQQLDAVVGPERLPEFSDVDAIPYVQAIVKEMLRWHIITPMGIPHVALEDDEYDGYHIPAGTVISPNLWYASSDDSQS